MEYILNPRKNESIRLGLSILGVQARLQVEVQLGHPLTCAMVKVASAVYTCTSVARPAKLGDPIPSTFLLVAGGE